MELSNQNRNRLILAGLVGLLVGITMGVVYGYVINPVEWVDAPVELTRPDVQEDYLRMAIDSFKLYFDQTKAIERWRELGDAGPAILAKVVASPGAQGSEAVKNFRELVTLSDTAASLESCRELLEHEKQRWMRLWLSTLGLVGVLGVFFYYRTQRGVVKFPSPTFPRPKIKEPAEELIPVEIEETPPLVQTMTTYILGDDLYDESFSIDTPDGEFLGECGIGIVNAIDDSVPKRVNAFDIWLFDKNEISTKSIVLMSDKAYADDLLRTQLSSKGMPVLAVVGKEIKMKTDGLHLVVRIVDFVCDSGDPQDCTYFERISLEFTVRALE